MEDQLVHLLAETQSNAEGPRKQAELQLRHLYTNEAFPLGLAAVAAHQQVSLDIRQAALLSLKNFVLAAWSNQFEEYTGQITLSDQSKQQLRHALLDLSTNGREERKIETAASYVVSKIASADYPSEWPELLPTLLQIIPNATDAQLHGSLRVLRDLVEDSLDEDQFFRAARDLVKVLYDVAVNTSRTDSLRALAVSVFRQCFDTLEMVMAAHKAAVKQFVDEALKAWMPFFLEMVKTRLPAPPADNPDQPDKQAEERYRGLVALKLQVVKILMKIRAVLPSALSPQSPQLFAATWEELTALQPQYQQMYIEDERQSRLIDADDLPYTLDFLVLEDIDFMQACFRAPPVRKQLEQQTAEGSTWVAEVMKLAVAYAQITTEEEGLWDVDVNIFLSEETSVTANYTPRTACGDLVIRLGEWLQSATTDGLLAYARTLYNQDHSGNWKVKEAALYILTQLLTEYHELDRQLSTEVANGFIEFIRFATQQSGDPFLRARGLLVAGWLLKTSGDELHQMFGSLAEMTLQAINDDESDVVKVSSIRAIQHYLQGLPHHMALSLQVPLITALSNFLQTQDLNDLTESEDLLTTMEETLRDAMLLEPRVVLDGTGLNMLFTIASHGANNFNLAMVASETFQDISGRIAAISPAAYGQLCEKVLPSLTGAFDVATLTEESALRNLAAELLSNLVEHAPEPLPPRFVQNTMPKLEQLLMVSTDDELLRSATSAVKFTLEHDAAQFFNWTNAAGKGGLEVALIIIDRLLGPSIDDNAANEVGGLAAEVVEKAGAERLGPYLMDLLRAVAVRVKSATQAQFIQSLILVFARLSLISAADVVDFLAKVQVDTESGLQVVMAKWLENSILFAGYDVIRQNVIALSKLYNLQDPRLAQIMVKGDLIVPKDSRIMTRSRARQNPDQYTIIPAPLKILKILVEELTASSGGHIGASNNGPPTGNNLDAEGAGADLDDEGEGSDDDDWEDDPTATLDLGLSTTKESLMAFGDGKTPHLNRGPDDETQTFLIEFFHNAAQKPGFDDLFNALTEDEREKLRMMGGQQ